MDRGGGKEPGSGPAGSGRRALGCRSHSSFREPKLRMLGGLWRGAGGGLTQITGATLLGHTTIHPWVF